MFEEIEKLLKQIVGEIQLLRSDVESMREKIASELGNGTFTVRVDGGHCDVTTHDPH